MPTRMPPPTSSGWCMPRYMRDEATNVTIAHEAAHARPRKRLFVNRDASTRRSAVNRERRSRVARRIAGVDREVFEANHARPMRVDEKRCRAIVPASTASANTTNAASRHFRKTTHTSAIVPTRMGRTRPPARVEPMNDASVRDDVLCAASQTSTRSSAAPIPQACSTTCVTRRPEADRQHCDRRESQEHRDDEAHHRMQTPERIGEPLRRAAVSRTENRQIPPFRRSNTAICPRRRLPSMLVRFHGHESGHARFCVLDTSMPVLLLSALALTVGIAVGASRGATRDGEYVGHAGDRRRPQGR